MGILYVDPLLSRHVVLTLCTRAGQLFCQW